MHLTRIACTIAALASASALAGTPNIVVFYADDLGIGDLGCYGGKDIRTPNIDGLAADGVRFTNYYAAAPVCSPSRAALLTGRYPIRAGMPGNASSMPGDPGMRGSEITLAELVKTRRYATALVGKWHLGFSAGTQPNDQGFDYFFGHHAGCIDYYSHMFYWQDPPHHDLYRNREEVHEEGRYMTDLIAREAVEFIQAHRGGPFLLYCAFNAPHYPMQAPEQFRALYADLPAKRAIYAAMVSAMDNAIGTVLGALRETGTESNTLVFFASDNGATTEMRANGSGGSNAPGRGHKFSLFEGGIHLPAIIRWPGQVRPGQIRPQLVCGIDLWPTVARILDAPVPTGHTIDGTSLLGVLGSPTGGGHEVLCWKQGEQRAIRRGNWKLVLDGLVTQEGGRSSPARGRDAVFLADLQADPGESRNLAADHPDLVADLTRRHDAWLRDVAGGQKQGGKDR